MYIAVAVAGLRRQWRKPSGYAATVALLYLLAAPCVASAQSQLTLDAITDVRVRDAIRGTISEARTKGVPDEPLLAKVREGVAKQSAPERIRDAVALLATRLERAQRALTPTYSVDELAAGAGALAQEVPEETLRNLRRAWPDKPLTVPLGVLTELVANGISVKKAAASVYALLERGASSAQIVALGDTVRSDIAAGRAPDASIELRTKGIFSLLQSQGAVTTDFIEQRGNPPRPPSRPPTRPPA